MIDLPYTALAAMMPLDRIVEALDDDRDGEADAAVWSAVLAAVSERLVDILGTDPAAEDGIGTERAVKVFAAELLYSRRGFSGDQNPWTRAAAEVEKRLRAHATGEERANPPSGGGSVLTLPAQTHLASGGLIA